MALPRLVNDTNKSFLYNVKDLLEENRRRIEPATKSPTQKSLQILRLLQQNGNRKVVHTFSMSETDLARKLGLTRQALSIHFKRLREAGFVQVGRGFINVTEEGLKAIGYHSNPVIVILRVSPQKRLEALAKVRKLPVIEIFTVTGDADAVLVVEQDQLDQILGILCGIDGILETKSLLTYS